MLSLPCDTQDHFDQFANSPVCCENAISFLNLATSIFNVMADTGFLVDATQCDG